MAVLFVVCCFFLAPCRQTFRDRDGPAASTPPRQTTFISRLPVGGFELKRNSLTGREGSRG